MKSEPSPITRRGLALGTIGLSTIFIASCALPQKEAWSLINQRGLIPVLIDGEQAALASSTAVNPSQESVVRVQAVTTPAIVKTPYADAVPGRPGYAFSPHTTPHKLVDVRGFRPGDEVRCPYTAQPFLVPDFKAVADASRPVPQRPVRPVAEVVSNTGITPEMIENGLAKLEPGPEMKAATPSPVEPVNPSPAPGTAPVPAAAVPGTPDLPYGSRVPGRPGFVYSPHAAKTQLVDVAGTAPGVVVKCPYTNKLFRVPEMNTEEIKPSTFPGTPAPETAGSPPAPGKTGAPPEKVEPSTPPAPPAPGTPPSALGSPR